MQIMDYDKITISILKHLGINRTYKGCYYIVSSINYIHENKTTFLPATKILYVYVARQHNTSSKCVEKNIRKVIEIIWKLDKNKSLLSKIFDKDYLTHKPGNIEFLLSLYNYIENNVFIEHILHTLKDNISYTCPVNDKPCGLCNEILHEIVNALYTN